MRNIVPEHGELTVAVHGKVADAHGLEADALLAERRRLDRLQRIGVVRGLLGTLVICTILYLLVCVVLTGMVPYQDISEGAPISDAFSQVGLGWASSLISIAAIAGLTSVILVDLPGHTPASVGILAQTASGPTLLAGDAVWSHLQIDRFRQKASYPGMLADAERDIAWETLHRLYSVRERVAIVPSHDHRTAPIRG